MWAYVSVQFKDFPGAFGITTMRLITFTMEESRPREVLIVCKYL